MPIRPLLTLLCALLCAFASRSLAATVPVYPPAQATDVPLAPLLTWRSDATPGGFQVQIARDRLFTALITERRITVPGNRVDNINTQVFGLPADTACWWRIRSLSDSAAWSDPIPFRTTAHPRPIPISPVGQVDTASALLHWSEMPDRGRFDLQLATTADFAHPLLTRDTIYATQSWVDALPAGATLYWRVRTSAWTPPYEETVIPAGKWSATGTFTTAATLKEVPQNHGGPLLVSRNMRQWGPLYRMNADGSDAQPLIDLSGENGNPALSQDGHTLAFTQNNQGVGELYVMQPDGSHVRQLTLYLPEEIRSQRYGLCYPQFTPDGNSLVFVVKFIRREEDTEGIWYYWNLDRGNIVYQVPLNGGQMDELGRDTRQIYGLAFAADGKSLLWSSIDTTPKEHPAAMTTGSFYERPDTIVTRYFLATKTPRTQRLEGAWTVIPTPAGARVAVVDTDRFVITDPDTGDRLVINRNANRMHHLCLSPDMRRLAYISDPQYGTVYTLNTMNVDGSEQRTIHEYDISDGYIAGLHDILWLPE